LYDVQALLGHEDYARRSSTRTWPPAAHGKVSIRWGVPLQEVASRMKVLHERVAGVDVHKDIRPDGTKRSGLLSFPIHHIRGCELAALH
jgi:hypothetical protein